jgi:hypothetical protein
MTLLAQCFNARKKACSTEYVTRGCHDGPASGADNFRNKPGGGGGGRE